MYYFPSFEIVKCMKCKELAMFNVPSDYCFLEADKRLGARCWHVEKRAKRMFFINCPKCGATELKRQFLKQQERVMDGKYDKLKYIHRLQ